ncbi:MAG: adenylate kinase [Candidatus Anstonellales archaeon]
MRAIVAGVPGAGKTTILKLVKQHVQTLNIINFGDVMLKYAKGLVKDRDEMRKLSITTIKTLQKKAARHISHVKGRNLIIDTHFSVKTKAGFMPGFNEDVLKIIKPEIMVLITAKPEHIWERRHTDLSRKRDIESLDDIVEHEKVNISYLITYSTMAFCPFKIIRNDNGMQEQAVKKLVDIFNKETE